MSAWRAWFKHRMTVHRQGAQKNLLIFSTPRSGTTWLAELLATQGRFKIVNEPFDLRIDVKREYLGLDTWESLLEPANRPVMLRYLQSFVAGEDRDLRFKRERPFSEAWRPVTDRVLFKILFAGEDDIEGFRRALDGEVLLLLRHPVPVSLSRRTLPRLHSFLHSPYAEYFTPEQRRIGREVMDTGDAFRKAVLDWTLQNAVPLRHRRPEWLVLSYEQLVLEPQVVLSVLTDRFGFPAPGRMQQRLWKASGSTGKSAPASRAVLEEPQRAERARGWLVGKWRDVVTPAQEAAAFDLLDAFGVHFYERGRLLPAHGECLAVPGVRGADVRLQESLQ
jgi:hypothetical protein